MKSAALRLTSVLAGDLRAAAARAYPDECCGLIEGVDAAGIRHALRLHETANRAHAPRTRFLIDPQAHFDLLRALRGTERRILGCFHSHPDGRAEPSTTDSGEARDQDFVWLIAGGAPDTGFALAAFLFTGDEGFAPLPLEIAAP